MNKYIRFADILQDKNIEEKSNAVSKIIEDFIDIYEIDFESSMPKLFEILKATFDKVDLNDIESIKMFAFCYNIVRNLAIKADIPTEEIINKIK